MHKFTEKIQDSHSRSGKSYVNHNDKVAQTKENVKYVCYSSLKERGWTDAMIRDYQLTPDKLVPNPHYRCMGEMKLYRIDKLTAIESGDWFKERYAKSLKRREAARKASTDVANRKRKETMELIDSIEIKIPNWSKERMFSTAINHYNNMWQNRGRYDKYIDDYHHLDNENLERITANFVRHGLTDYNDVLNELCDCVGVGAAHDILQERINSLVHEKYFT